MATAPLSLPAQGTDSPYVLVNFRAMTGLAHQNDLEAVVIAGQRIAATGRIADVAGSLPRVDLQGLHLSPGFIDLQLNGCGGVLFNSAISAATLDTMHAANLRSGCTSFLPTLISCSDDDMIRAVTVVRDYRRRHPQRVPGIHLEGPYLNPQRRGIHHPDFIRPPCPRMIRWLCEQADAIAMVTLAPEVCPDGTIEQLAEAGITVAMGHSNARCQQARAAEGAGVRFATHLHNAMSPLTSREPGVVGAVLDSDTLGAGIIADGHHLAWENLRIAHRLLQDRLVLVTDGTTPAGTTIPQFEFAGQTIYHRDGKCTNSDGTLAGSALTMIQAVANSIHQGLPSAAVIRMATVNAARAIGQQEQIGAVAAGYPANLALFDQQLQLWGTISDGQLTRADDRSPE